MLKQNHNIFLIFILFFILATLTSAFIIQYVLGHQPCNLCLYERAPYIISTFLIINILFFKKYVKTTLFILFLVFFASAILSFYHFGIEQDIFSESNICGANNLEILKKEEILKELVEKNISCKDADFKIFGLSLATFNIIFSVILSVIFARLFINYGKN